MPVYISNFQLIRPCFQIDQENSLEWIAKAHACAEKAQTGTLDPHFYEELKGRLFRLGFGKKKIDSRGIQIKDLLHTDWSAMAVYPLNKMPHGMGFKQRSLVFDTEVSKIFEDFYPDHIPLPDHLIHVTCTGYVAPSPAQKIVSQKQQGQTTLVTHAYHMGCYASIPALRIGSGTLQTSAPCRVDIVHTELCSLHMHPLKHSTEQLVVQSLFADGFIKYSLESTPPSQSQSFLSILALHEEIIPNSALGMSWSCEDHGLGMTLAKEVPALIADALPGYLERLFQKAGVKATDPLFYAIHPGGPKIVFQIQQLLELNSQQLFHSQEILRTCGNMSSATLPHIWNLLLLDSAVAKGAYIVSLAFGPGLSISGGVFEKKEV